MHICNYYDNSKVSNNVYLSIFILTPLIPEKRRLIFVFTLLPLGDGKLGHTETVTLIN